MITIPHNVDLQVTSVEAAGMNIKKFYYHYEKRIKLAFFNSLMKCNLSLIFTCRENPRRSAVLVYPDHPIFCLLMKNQNGQCCQQSEMLKDKLGEFGESLNSRHRSHKSQISKMVSDL